MPFHESSFCIFIRKPAQTYNANLYSVACLYWWDSAAFGVGVSGTPAFVYQATPYYHYKFVPKLEYWIAYGNFTQGQVLIEEPDKIVNAHQFQFPENIYEIGLNFAPTDPWSQIK